MQKQLFFFIVFAFYISDTVTAQKVNAAFEYKMERAVHPVNIDGEDNDEAWQNIKAISSFHQVLPMDTSMAKVKTEVKMTYDEKNIYVLFINHDKLPGPYMVESLKRDFNFQKNDNDVIFIDPFDDQTNGFTFGSNAMGAQWDGLLFDGGQANLGWENKWHMEVKYNDDKWIWEVAIPFKTLRYKKGIKTWGINFSRNDLKTTEKSAWAPVPRQFPTASLAYTGNLLWNEPPPPAGPNISLIPFYAGKISMDRENNIPTRFTNEVGLDAKVGLTSSLNLDLTVNPDFSQVEVDRQQTNLDRFELFFPERRQFFIENGDLFTSFGYQNIRPFFSRRIGLDVPIIYGARVSGKLNKDWRIGAMDMQTGKGQSGQPAQNFGVLAIQRRMFSRSNIAAMLVNKQSLDYDPTKAPDPDLFTKFNRNFAMEYNLASADNVWKGKLLFLHSFGSGVNSNDNVFAGNINYSIKKLNLSFQAERVGNNYRAEVGYVPRLNYGSVNFLANYLFFPTSKHILSHGPQGGGTIFFNKNFSREVEDEFFISYKVTFRSTAYASIWTARNYTELLQKFDPTNYAGIELPIGSKHIWHSWGTEFVSRPQSLFTFSFNSRYGGYYSNGTRLRLSGEVGYRFQPYVAIALAANYNGIRFDDNEAVPNGLKNTKFDFWLLGPRIDVTFTNKLFLTNFIQYNNQTKNVGHNTRIQWRYSPASDMYLVYTDNYFSDGFNVRNRAIIFKFNYWWNV